MWCALWISQSELTARILALTFMATDEEHGDEQGHEETIINRRLSDVWLAIENIYVLNSVGSESTGAGIPNFLREQRTRVYSDRRSRWNINYHGCGGVSARRRSVAAMNIISNCVEIHPLFGRLTSAVGCVAWPTHLK